MTERRPDRRGRRCAHEQERPLYYGSPADLLKGRQYNAGVRVYDIAHPEARREIAFMATEAPQRIWKLD
jgi:hypothetical protein